MKLDKNKSDERETLPPKLPLNNVVPTHANGLTMSKVKSMKLQGRLLNNIFLTKNLRGKLNNKSLLITLNISSMIFRGEVNIMSQRAPK